MARKSANKTTGGSTTANRGDEVEASVIALAERLGTFLGQVTAKGEGWLDNDTLREQATMIREGASEVLKRVNSAGAAAKKSVASAKQTVTSAKQTVTKAVKSARAAKPAEEEESTAKPSRGAVDAPGKKHRKPPPQQKVMRGMTEPMGKRQGLKTYKVGSGRRG